MRSAWWPRHAASSCYFHRLSWLNYPQGKIPLVIRVHDADTIASIIKLKEETDPHLHHSLRFTLFGATEAHLLADELAEAQFGVIVAPVRPYPSSWEMRRM